MAYEVKLYLKPPPRSPSSSYGQRPPSGTQNWQIYFRRGKRIKVKIKIKGIMFTMFRSGHSAPKKSLK